MGIIRKVASEKGVSMIKKHYLEDLIIKSNLVCFETDFSSEKDISNIIFLKNNEICELIRFADTNKIRTILYSYNYYDEAEYLIGEDMLLDYDNRIVKAIKDKVSDYNYRNSKLDFARPMKLYAYCLYEGCLFAILYEDYWIDEMYILSAYEKLDELVDSCDEILEEISTEAKNKKEEVLSSMKEFILADTEFFFCTNQKLRKAYIYKLLHDKKEYAKVFSGYTGAYNYIELLWKEHILNWKEHKSKK